MLSVDDCQNTPPKVSNVALGLPGVHVIQGSEDTILRIKYEKGLLNQFSLTMNRSNPKNNLLAQLHDFVSTSSPAQSIPSTLLQLRFRL